jgi:multiple sugar transport system substrate-binding protein
MLQKRFLLFTTLLLILSLLMAACAGQPSVEVEEPAADAEEPVAEAEEPATQEEVTITVWDYYGESSPIVPIVESFEGENPGINVQVESLDWDSTLEKLNVVMTGGTPPDIVTLDMTWLPTFAPLGAFTDLTELSGGQVNGIPIEDAFSPGAIKAMSFGDQLPAMLYDFDVYALYYRSDLFEDMGLDVPTTWDELLTVAQKLGADGQYKYAVMPDSFHAAQFIYENGGNILDKDNTAAIFNTPEAVEAVEFYSGLVDKGAGYVWSFEEGWEITPGLKDGRIAMFSDGPYYMGIIKDAAPEMSGKWKVAPHPYNTQPGSYLGGTGLVIPAKAEHPEAAWKFIEFAMTLENQIGVFENAGAAPGLLTALESPKVNLADPYFGDQQTLSVFLKATESAYPFPYVREWNTIDEALTIAMEEILLGDVSIQEALDTAAETVNTALAP